MKWFILNFFLLFSCITNAQRDWSQVEIRTQKLTDDVYVLFGAGGNIGLAIGEEHAYLIDDQFAPLSEKILSAVAAVTDKPLKFVVNTHWHGDHVGGNENMANQGAMIVTHENVRKRMSMRVDRGERGISEPAPFKARAEITFNDKLTIHLDSVRTMHLMHVENAHTDGDTYIYMPDSNVIHMGDNLNAGYPFIDISSGGDIDGFIKNLNMVLFIIDEDTQVIPGHGEVTNRDHIRNYRDMLSTIRTRVKAAKDSGKALEEVLTMNLSSEWDKKMGQGFIGPEPFITAIYNTVD